MKLGIKLGIRGATIPPTRAQVLLIAYIVPLKAVGKVSIVIRNIIAKAALDPNLPIVTQTYAQVQWFFKKWQRIHPNAARNHIIIIAGFLPQQLLISPTVKQAQKSATPSNLPLVQREPSKWFRPYWIPQLVISPANHKIGITNSKITSLLLYLNKSQHFDFGVKLVLLESSEPAISPIIFSLNISFLLIFAILAYTILASLYFFLANKLRGDLGINSKISNNTIVSQMIFPMYQYYHTPTYWRQKLIQMLLSPSNPLFRVENTLRCFQEMNQPNRIKLIWQDIGIFKPKKKEKTKRKSNHGKINKRIFMKAWVANPKRIIIFLPVQSERVIKIAEPARNPAKQKLPKRENI